MIEQGWRLKEMDAIEASYWEWRTVTLGDADIPAWWPNEPASTSRIVDIRKVRRISGLGEDRLQIRFTKTNWVTRCLPCNWELFASVAKAKLDKGEAKTPRGYFKPIPIEPDRRSKEEDLYGVWLPKVTDHEYIFLCDCKQRESEERTLSKDQIKRITSIRRRSMCRDLLAPPSIC